MKMVRKKSPTCKFDKFGNLPKDHTPIENLT